MRLTPEQIAQFDRDGYLFFPDSSRRKKPKT